MPHVGPTGARPRTLSNDAGLIAAMPGGRSPDDIFLAPYSSSPGTTLGFTGGASGGAWAKGSGQTAYSGSGPEMLREDGGAASEAEPDSELPFALPEELPFHDPIGLDRYPGGGMFAHDDDDGLAGGGGGGSGGGDGDGGSERSDTVRDFSAKSPLHVSSFVQLIESAPQLSLFATDNGSNGVGAESREKTGRGSQQPSNSNNEDCSGISGVLSIEEELRDCQLFGKALRASDLAPSFHGP